MKERERESVMPVAAALAAEGVDDLRTCLQSPTGARRNSTAGNRLVMADFYSKCSYLWQFYLFNTLFLLVFWTQWKRLRRVGVAAWPWPSRAVRCCCCDTDIHCKPFFVLAFVGLSFLCDRVYKICGGFFCFCWFLIVHLNELTSCDQPGWRRHRLPQLFAVSCRQSAHIPTTSARTSYRQDWLSKCGNSRSRSYFVIGTIIPVYIGHEFTLAKLKCRLHKLPFLTDSFAQLMRTRPSHPLFLCFFFRFFNYFTIN